MTQAIATQMATDSRVTRHSDWALRYSRLLLASDLVAATACVLVAHLLGGLPERVWGIRHVGSVPTPIVIMAVTVVAIVLMLTISGSRAQRYVGVGVTEYRRVINSTLVLFGAGGLTAYALSIVGMQRFLIAALALSLVGLVTERWLCRRWLAARRREGRMSHRVLLVGSDDSIAVMEKALRRTPTAGLKVVGACTASGATGGFIDGTDIPMSGSIANLPAALDAVDADTVVVTSANEMSSALVRELSWKLEPGHQHLVVAPSLTDIGGPRLHTRPVAGLPLIHVETPRYDGGKLYAKRLLDVLGSAVLIAVLSPVLLVTAVLVRATTPGAVFFRQERIGLRGDRFAMLKFRSMYTDAEARLHELADRSEGNGVMFKMKDDPRVTAIGAFLRRFSLDELPQLFNVFRGSMSIVGPRPPLASEVQQYDTHVHRRFLVKPGITGLWQVSGRSDLDWEETVRLDLYYVENWTMAGDLMILWRTAKAVLGKDGAY